MAADSHLVGIDDFKVETKTFDEKSRRVFSAGKGPTIIVISEVPGITPEQIDFADRLVTAGYRVVMPELFGRSGKAMDNLYAANTIGWACVSREFSTLALRKTSPITEWLRALARDVGEPLGVVGMCLTGGFALAMMVDDVVAAPVLSQPSLPFAISKSHASDLGISDDDLDQVKERVDDGACVLGFRFTHDRLVPEARFERLKRELGEGFIAVELDSSPGNPHGFGQMAHSVLTHEFVDEEGHPTRDAFDRLLAFFDERL